MADNSKTLDILIRTRAELAGARAVEEQLERDIGKAKALGENHEELSRKLATVKESITAATNANKDLGKAGEAAGSHLHALHKIFHALNEVVPGLGVLMQAAFSPIGAAVSIAVTALRFFHEKLKDINEELDRLSEEAAKPATHRLEAMRETVVKTAEGMAELHDKLDEAAKSQETLAQKTEQAAASMREQSADIAKLQEAAMGKELAQLELMHQAGLVSEQKYDDQKLAIESDYLKKKRELEEREIETEILIKKRGIDMAQASQPELTANAEQAEKKRQRTAADLASLRPDRELEEEKKRTAGELEKWEKSHQGLRWSGLVEQFQQIGSGKSQQEVDKAMNTGADGDIFAPDFLRATYDEWDRLKRAAESAQREWTASPGIEARRKVDADRAAREADRAARDAEGNRRFITEGSADVDARTAGLRERHKANAELNASEEQVLKLKSLGETDRGKLATKDVTDAEGIAKALGQHKNVSDESKEQLRDIASKIAGHQVSLLEAVKMMNWAATNTANFSTDVLRLSEAMEGFAAALPTIKRRLSFVEQQTQDIDSRSRADRAR